MRFKKFRLSSGRDLVKVIFGRKIISDFFELRVRRNEVGFPRFVVVVPKKVVRKAVKRNRMKRIVREAMYQFLKEGKVPPLDIVIRVKGDLSHKKSYDVKAIFEEEIFPKLKNLFYNKIQM